MFGNCYSIRWIYFLNIQDTGRKRSWCATSLSLHRHILHILLIVFVSKDLFAPIVIYNCILAVFDAMELSYEQDLAIIYEYQAL